MFYFISNNSPQSMGMRMYLNANDVKYTELTVSEFQMASEGHESFPALLYREGGQTLDALYGYKPNELVEFVTKHKTKG